MNELSLKKQANVKAKFTKYMDDLAEKASKAKEQYKNVKTNEGMRRQGQSVGIDNERYARLERNEALKDLGIHAGKGAAVVGGGALTLAALAKGVKSMKGGKSVATIPPSKMKKLKALLKDKKVQMGAGAAGGAGLAAMLSSKS